MGVPDYGHVDTILELTFQVCLSLWRAEFSSPDSTQ
jgi:hypothetical protein